MDWTSFGKSFAVTAAYSLLGIAMFALSFVVIGKVSPFSIRKEIEEDQNVALALLISAIILGLSLIIASAIGG